MSEEKNSFVIAGSCGEKALYTLLNGGKWEWSPDCAIDGIFIPYNCGGDDGCQTYWHSMWYVLGFRIEDGHLYETVQTCDSDGNWEYEDEKDVDDPDYDEWRKQYDWEVHKKVMREYSEWVVRHGEDPLDEFNVKTTEKRYRQVTIHLVDGQFVVKCPNRLNPQVKDYLNLEGNRLSEIDWKTIEEFEQKAYTEKVVRKNRNSITILVETNESRSEKSIRSEIRRKARRFLKK